MNLGAFSISLAVKDIQASKDFYEKLGFQVSGGQQEQEQKWLILRNGDTVIGLFEGMFEKNMLTFNPGWNQHCQKLKDFDDVRDIQRSIEAHGVQCVQKADENSTGPASCIIVDPDGNPVLLDQHV